MQPRRVEPVVCNLGGRGETLIAAARAPRKRLEFSQYSRRNLNIRMTFDLTMAADLLTAARDPNITPATLLATLRTLVGRRRRKLTEDQVRQIRDDVRQVRLIAKSYGVSEATISTVRRWQAYIDVAGPPTRSSKGVPRDTGWPVRTPDGLFASVKVAAQHHGTKPNTMYAWIRRKPGFCYDRDATA